MKKILFLSLGVVFTLLLAGCSNDENIENEEFSNTNWELRTYSSPSSEIGQSIYAEITLVFRDAQRVRVICNNPIWNEIFMPSGDYHYTYSKKSNTLTINEITFQYEIRYETEYIAEYEAEVKHKILSLSRTQDNSYSNFTFLNPGKGTF